MTFEEKLEAYNKTIQEYEKNDIFRDVLEWGYERRLVEYNEQNELDMLSEELDEYVTAVKNNDINEVIDALCDLVVIFMQSQVKIGITNQSIFRLNKFKPYISFISYIPDMVENLGYDFNNCMIETIKEISSRQQDPEQKKRWDNGDYKVGEKWQKWKEQPKETLYKADYSKCKLES